MSLSRKRATAEVGWHKRAGGAYGDAYIDDIEDPSNAALKRILTAIPSPFARIHLFDAAFGFVSHMVAGKVQHSGSTDFHRMVSDCLDVLELLYNLDDHATPIVISKWTPGVNLNGLEQSPESGQKLLASTLKLYLEEDRDTANFGKQPVFYQLLVNHEIIAVSSPLTLFITAPEARAIAEVHSLINPETKNPYFSVIRPLHERQPDFQLYLQSLFAPRRPSPPGGALSQLCKRMHKYLTESGQLVQQANADLALKIRALQTLAAAGSLPALTPVSDSSNQPVQVLGYPVSKGPSRNRPRLSLSPVALKSPRLPAGTLPPILWTGETDSFGVTQATVEPPPVNLPLLGNRVLPDLQVPYPFLCASDLIEDKIVRVPFIMNGKQFCVPRYEGFEPGFEYAYLLPLKKDFFNYFEPKAVTTMATFRRVGDGVIFELAVPARDRTVTFQKTYFDAPQQSKYGKIVNAGMNCAIYPFLSIKDHTKTEQANNNRPTKVQPNFNSRYWIMLIDAEREPAMRPHRCFDLRFYRFTESGVAPFVEGEAGAPLSVTTTHRSDKNLDVGSTFYELVGDRCDLIQVDSFGFETERDRKTSAFVVPNWEDRPLGTRKARVAIDFGTTNTHMAWRFEGEQPVPFQIDQSDLQIALLNAPNTSLAAENARIDTFPGKLVGTGIRLHHEFLPGIIGPGSRFHFPLRTATSEQPNLQFGNFHTLRTINISFIFGLDAPRIEERITTDLKWSLEAAPEVEQRVNAFIEELLFMIRTKLLMHDVDPSQLILTWFRPLSFDYYTKNQFESIWRERAADVLGMPADRVINITESEAPYYYHRESGLITSKPTVCVDIGGGSTDVVFFDGKEPTFGTSFSFAGNALWGTGYDRLGLRESGIVRNLSGEIKKRMDAIKTADSSSSVKDAYAALLKTKNPSREIMNFCFGVDSQIHITDALSKNSAVKCLALIHYAAIVYHCAQLMKSQQMAPPEYICFSGRGSQYLNILDVTPAKQAVARFTQAIVEHVFGAKLTVPVSLKFAPESKEATCNGGLLKELETASDGVIQEGKGPKPLVAIGDGGPPPATLPVYGSIDANMKTQVAANLRNFVDMVVLLSNKPETNFKTYFGVTFPADVVEATLKEKLEESIDFGLDLRPSNKKPSEEISETLFFYPLIQNLFELGDRLL